MLYVPIYGTRETKFDFQDNKIGICRGWDNLIKWNVIGLAQTGDMKSYYVKPVQDIDGTGGYYLFFSKDFNNRQAEVFDEWYLNPEDISKRIVELNIDWQSWISDFYEFYSTFLSFMSNMIRIFYL